MNFKETYRQICSETSLPLFFQDWFMDVVCLDESWDVSLAYDGDEVVCVLPYYFKKKAGIRYITMPDLCKYMGPYFLKKPKNLSQSHKWLKLIIEALPDFDIFKQNFHPSLSNWLPFHWNGYYSQNRFTYCLNATNLDEVYRNVNRNIRRNIEGAQEHLNVELFDDVDAFYDVAKMSFERQDLTYVLSKSFVQDFHDAMKKHGQGQMFLAKNQSGDIVDVSYLVWDDRTAYYLLSGDDPAHRHLGGGILLTWKAIEYTNQVLNLGQFDFLGSMMPNIEAIRRQFGAYQQSYVYVTKYRWPIHRTMDRIKNKLF